VNCYLKQLDTGGLLGIELALSVMQVNADDEAHMRQRWGVSLQATMQTPHRHSKAAFATGLLIWAHDVCNLNPSKSQKGFIVFAFARPPR
jgi:hypothetical protein